MPVLNSIDVPYHSEPIVPKIEGIGKMFFSVRSRAKRTGASPNCHNKFLYRETKNTKKILSADGFDSRGHHKINNRGKQTLR